MFSCEFCEVFKKTYFTEHLRLRWSLSFKKFYIVHKKVFESLAANEFLSNSKNHLRFSCISISCIFIFSITCFSTNQVFNTLAWRKRSIQSNYQEVAIKRYFCEFVWEMFRHEHRIMKYCVRAVLNSWELFEEFCAEFSAAIFIKVLSYQSFDVKCLLLSWDACVYRQAREW